MLINTTPISRLQPADLAVAKSSQLMPHRYGRRPHRYGRTTTTQRGL
ncbi:MAG: hypothetical protein Q7T55_09295 [Solirubrobacteraceae bacterium]|nr:hypothetical protein [Solirubrobacteraceae bacterium]